MTNMIDRHKMTPAVRRAVIENWFKANVRIGIGVDDDGRVYHLPSPRLPKGVKIYAPKDIYAHFLITCDDRQAAPQIPSQAFWFHWRRLARAGGLGTRRVQGNRQWYGFVFEDSIPFAHLPPAAQRAVAEDLQYSLFRYRCVDGNLPAPELLSRLLSVLK